MTRREVEVLVVGGGPAGAAAAIELVRRGRRVLLAEAAPGVRDRVCGEFLSPEAVPVLRRLGVLEELRCSAPPELTSARFTAPPGRELCVELPAGAGRALGISRRLLDDRLLRRAAECGATVLRGARFREPIRDADGVVRGAVLATSGGQTRAACGVLVGADGRASTVARALGLDRPPRPPGRCAVKAHFRPGRGMAGLEGSVEVHLFDGGYVGMQHVEGGRVNVSAVIDAAVVRRIGGGALRVLVEAARRSPAAAARLCDATPAGPALSLYPLDRERTEVCGPGFLLAGDAARVVPPFAGEGISMALHSGLLTAEAAHDALEGGGLAAYRRSRHRLLDPARRASRFLEPLLYRPALAGPVMAFLRSAPVLAGALVRATRVA